MSQQLRPTDPWYGRGGAGVQLVPVPCYNKLIRPEVPVRYTTCVAHDHGLHFVRHSARRAMDRVGQEYDCGRRSALTFRQDVMTPRRSCDDQHCALARGAAVLTACTGGRRAHDIHWGLKLIPCPGETCETCETCETGNSEIRRGVKPCHVMPLHYCSRTVCTYNGRMHTDVGNATMNKVSGHEMQCNIPLQL